MTISENTDFVYLAPIFRHAQSFPSLLRIDGCRPGNPPFPPLDLMFVVPTIKPCKINDSKPQWFTMENWSVLTEKRIYSPQKGCNHRVQYQTSTLKLHSLTSRDCSLFPLMTSGQPDLFFATETKVKWKLHCKAILGTSTDFEHKVLRVGSVIKMAQRQCIVQDDFNNLNSTSVDFTGC